eukprot:TRINITY_DN4429_c0_g1_i1.p1 TRINITY_DN4429_c0_g1~~TRINITY_DN4429_c0_g1_i1.p1  ORF type:complete len:455 (+),score=49.56 TRINITY_DN4429_c0_g1_i1:44-1408(+)
MPREKHHLFTVGDRVIYKGDDCREWTPACVASVCGGRYGIEIDGSRIRYQVSVRCLKHAYCQCDEIGESVCEPCNSVTCSSCVKYHGARSCYVLPVKERITYKKVRPKASRRFSIVKEQQGENVSPMSTPKLHPSPSLLAQQAKHRKKGINTKLILVGAIIVIWVTFMFFVMSSHTLQIGNNRFSSVQWLLESGALSEGNTILTQNTTVNAAQSVCSSMDSCYGFTFLKGGKESGDYLIFYKGWGTKKVEDPNWVSYLKDVSTTRNIGATQVETEVGKVALSTDHGDIKISIRSPNAGEIFCRAGLMKGRPKSMFMRAEAVPPNFGIDGFYGPPYALLQGTITGAKDSSGASVGLCDFRDLQQNRLVTKPLIKPNTAWIIKTDKLPQEDSLHFFIALAAHPEWEGQFEFLGNVDILSSEETLTSIMHQETISKKWGQTTVQELQHQIPISVKWL